MKLQKTIHRVFSLSVLASLIGFAAGMIGTMFYNYTTPSILFFLSPPTLIGLSGLIMIPGAALTTLFLVPTIITKPSDEPLSPIIALFLVSAIFSFFTWWFMSLGDHFMSPLAAIRHFTSYPPHLLSIIVLLAGIALFSLVAARTSNREK